MKKLLVLAVLLLGHIGYAQVANNTSLVGTVTDQAGNVVAGAKVVGTNVDTKVEYPATTNQEGYYSITFINPGTYDISVEQSGFSKIITKGVIVPINMAVRTDVVLRVGSTSSEVSISAENPPLSTDDALLGETIESQRVHDLPLNGRNAINLAATTSNITIGGNTLTGNPPGNTASGSGTRGVNNSISLDGISIVNNLITTATLSPNPDALDSVQTQNGNYTAQYGDYIGVHINMVTKTGGNKFHGTAYDYLQNDIFNSYTFGSDRTKPKSQVRYNLFGGVLSGPVIIPHLYNGPDKTFFTASYEGLRQSNASLSTGTVLTNRMRSLDFSDLINTSDPTKSILLKDPATGQTIPNNRFDQAGYQINPISAALLSYIPLPTNSGTVNNFVGNVPNVVNANNTLDRVDHTIGDNIRLFGRFAWTKTFNIGGAIVPTSNSYTPTMNRNAAAGYTHIITPNLVNDLRGGFNILTTQNLNYFSYNNIQGAGSALGIPGFNADVVNNNPGLPTINITNYQGLGSDGTNWYQDDRTLTIYDQISYTHGKHNLMAGISFRKLTLGRASTNGARGTFTFNGQYTGDAAADFLLSAVQADTTPYFQVKVGVGQWRDGFFVQDNWQVTPKLTLQYGVRYELPQVAYSLNGVGRKLTQDQIALYPQQGGTNAQNATSYPGYKYSNPSHDNIAPRLGFAYRATDRTVIRGGGGVYYNAVQLNAFTLTNQNYPYSSSTGFSGKKAGSGPPDVTFQTPTPGAGSTSPVGGTLGSYVTAITQNWDLPSERMYQWNVDVGQEMWHDAGFELQYIGSRSVHLNESWYSNQPEAPGANAPASRYSTSTAVINANRPNQYWGQIRTIQNDGFATYHGLTAILRQRMSHGLSMTASYTWSHNLDTSNDANSSGSAMWQGHLRLDYGNASNDIRHRFVATATYALPSFSNSGFWVRQSLGGWQLNGIWDMRSGIPFNVTSSGDRVYVGTPGSAQRPNFVHTGSNTCNKAFILKYGSTRSCIDTTAYALPPQGVYGNLHRNDQHGPNQLAQNSLSLFKNFKIWEDVAFQFRAEAFNFLNHGNAGAASNPIPNTTLSNNTLSNPNDPTSFTVPTAFGTMTGSGQRIFQFAGKINF